MRRLRRAASRFVARWMLAQTPDTWGGRAIQYIFDARLGPAGAGPLAALRHRLFKFLGRWIVILGDPPVKGVMYGRRLTVPFSHRGPIQHHGAPAQDTNLGRIAGAVAARYPDLTIIDVGANIGDSLAAMREQTSAPALCIEGEDKYFAALCANAVQLGEAYPVQAFLSDTAETIRAQVRRKPGTARIRPGMSADLVRLIPLPEVLAQHPRFARAKLLKIDTDGFDGKVLRGAAGWLAEARPVAYFEYDPNLLALYGDGGLTVFGLLRQAGYRGLLLYLDDGTLLMSATTDEWRRLEEVCVFISGLHQRYLDVCAFHGEDDTLFKAVRQSEMQLFINHKGLGRKP